jgi:hypothetical protein
MKIFVNGFWGGFKEGTDGVHFGAFRKVLFNDTIEFTDSIEEADILLESHFGPSAFPRANHCSTTIFFSGEADVKVPPQHEYTVVLGSQPQQTFPPRNNFRPFPLFLLYEFCKPFDYYASTLRRTTPPPKQICAIISSDHPGGPRFRTRFIDELLRRTNGTLHIDFGGRYKNNIGYTVPGSYHEQPILDFYKQYRVVLALENNNCEHYMTEKITNPLRAGTVPVYYGSPRIREFINPKRMVQIQEDDIDQAIQQIQRLCTDDAYWLEMVNQQPIFIKTLDECFAEIAEGIRSILFQGDL